MRLIFTNCYILLLPILIWNILFINKLPLSYQPSEFNRDMPIFVLIGENIFRSIIFILPLALKFDWKPLREGVGLLVYGAGSILYYLSWIALIYMPDSSWSLNIMGFSAPAYTPIIWLFGISLAAKEYYFNISYSKWHLLVPSLFFSGFHISHAVIVYNRTY